MRTLRFEVTVKNVPNEISAALMESYIRDAVRTWMGSLDPNEPLFDMRQKDFIVKKQRSAITSSKE